MDDPSMSVDCGFVYTTDQLLKNLCFNHEKCAPFKIHHCVMLKRLSNGLIDRNVDASVYEELKKFNFKIDLLNNYIINVLDYEFVVVDHDLTTIHILDAATKNKLGHLNVSVKQDDNQILLITAFVI
ncbi:hypothetical protein [Parapoynx stagnalis nucleopolyhedrovirus]|uniref:Uncharacterized protein n=1 Tax=Parapoynx stagnalis nucleopolyhedrovirus TaxID=2993413 RepID=A0A9E7YCA1_9ABAC|nr:hypothetical protein [Parapoynx stagnalis nucleopolyhedrovirus]